jgi:phosphate-selective porin OprO/OprP
MITIARLGRPWLAGLAATLLLALAATAAAGDAPRKATSVEQRLRELEEEVRALRQQQQEAQAAAAESEPVDAGKVDAIVDEKLKKQKVLAGWQDGFFLQSASGDFKFKLRGYTQADYRFFPFEDGDTGTDSFFLRRVRPIFEGTVYKYFDFRIMPDFGGGQTVLQDAYMDVKYFPYAVLRAGKFKEPFSLERLQSGTDLLFIERAISQNLAPNRDVGIQLSGDVASSAFTYQLGIFNGVFDGASSDGDLQTDKDFVGRVFTQPFINTDWNPVKSLGFGLAGTIGKRSNEPESALTYKTAGRSNFYRYQANANVIGKGTQWRISPQAYYYWGPFGAMGEYIVSDGSIRGTLGTAPDVTHPRADEHSTGWFLQASWVLTGENASYKGVVPIDNFDPFNRRWGAFEIAARVSNVDLDDEALEAGLAAGTDEAWAYTAGANWYLNRAFKVQLNYERTDFDGEPTFSGQARDHEDVLITRFQIAF